MTREIALHCMKAASELERELCEECPIYGQTGCDHCFEDALQYVIRMLEQKPTTKNDLGVDWESYKDIDGNSLDDLILEVLQNNFDCGNTYGYKVADEIIGLLPSVTPQEQFKPMVEIDLYSVIKQKYIEREVFDKIRAEINNINLNEVASKYEDRFYGFQREVIKILDKYRIESEVKE